MVILAFKERKFYLQMKLGKNIDLLNERFQLNLLLFQISKLVIQLLEARDARILGIPEIDQVKISLFRLILLRLLQSL